MKKKNSYLFLHDNKTQTDFKTDVEKLLKLYGKEYIDSNESWIGANTWIGFISEKMSTLGYKSINTIKHSFFGAYIIEGDINDSEEKEWRNVIGDELMDYAIVHNNNLKDRFE